MAVGKSIISEETRKRLSESHKGHKHSEATKRKISKSLTGKKYKPWSIESRYKKSEACKGRKLSDEIRKRMSESHKGHKGYWLGKHPSRESIEKGAEKRKGKNHHNWKGGTLCRSGRIYNLVPNHPFSIGGYVRRSRLIVEKRIGRYLQPYEIIHHKNAIKDDDRYENLQIVTRAEHMRIHEISKLGVEGRKKWQKQV